MFGTLLVKEIRDHLKTFRFSAALISTFILVIVSVWFIGNDYLEQQEVYSRLVAEYEESNHDVYVPSQISPVLMRPNSPLSIFAQGQLAHLGNGHQISRYDVPSSADDFLTVNRLLYSIPSFDLMTVFIFAISLFGILFTYDAFSGEKERGSLRLICSYQVTRATVFGVKFLAGVIVLAIPFLISFLSALLILLYLHGIQFSVEQWMAIAAMSSVVVFFGAVFVALGLISSAFVRRSSTSLALSLLLWTLAVIIAPIVANNVAAAAHPLFPREEISKFAQEESTRISMEMREWVAGSEYGLSSNGSGGIGGHSPNWLDGRREWLEEQCEYIRFYEPKFQRRAEQIWDLRQRHNARKAEQYVIADMLKVVSPAHQLRRAFTALAGTDYRTHEEFMRQCRRYREIILEDFNNRGYFTDNTIAFFTRRTWDEMTEEKLQQRQEERRRLRDAGEPIGMEAEFGPLPASMIPEFSYGGGEPSYSDALWPAAILAFIAMLEFLIGFFAFIRYDVR